MSISTLENTASVRALDFLHAAQAHADLAADMRAAEIAAVRSVTGAITSLHPSHFTAAALAQIVVVLTCQVEKALGWLPDDKDCVLAVLSNFYNDLKVL